MSERRESISGARMRVILEVTSGSAVGRKLLLDTGQQRHVGRSEWADMCFGWDGHMSARHFALCAEKDHCIVEDLQSSNGTFVNGKPICGRARVRHGDEIRAGETTFRIRTEDSELLRGTAPIARKATAVATAVQATERATFTVESCDSGLTLCRGDTSEIAPEEVALRLGRLHTAWLVVDFNRLGADRPADLKDPEYLFDWFPAHVAAMVSPVVICQSETQAWGDLLSRGWGEDAVVCLFSDLEKSDLLEHLRKSIGPLRPGNTPAGLVGLCWPSVMALYLAHNRPASAAAILSGMVAVLTEFPDLPITWQLFGEYGIVSLLQEVGLERADANRS